MQVALGKADLDTYLQDGPKVNAVVRANLIHQLAAYLSIGDEALKIMEEPHEHGVTYTATLTCIAPRVSFNPEDPGSVAAFYATP